MLLFQLKAGGLGIESVFEIVPQTHFGERFFDSVVQGGVVHASLVVKPQAEDHVFANRDGQRIGPLEDHAHSFAQFNQRDVGVVNVFVEDFDFPFGGDVVVAFVHPVEAA